MEGCGAKRPQICSESLLQSIVKEAKGKEVKGEHEADVREQALFLQGVWDIVSSLAWKAPGQFGRHRTTGHQVIALATARACRLAPGDVENLGQGF